MPRRQQRVNETALAVRRRYQRGGKYYDPSRPKLAQRKEALYRRNVAKRTAAKRRENAFLAAVGAAAATYGYYGLYRNPAIRTAVKVYKKGLRRRAATRALFLPGRAKKLSMRFLDDISREAVITLSKASGKSTETILNTIAKKGYQGLSREMSKYQLDRSTRMGLMKIDFTWRRATDIQDPRKTLEFRRFWRNQIRVPLHKQVITDNLIRTNPGRVTLLNSKEAIVKRGITGRIRFDSPNPRVMPRHMQQATLAELEASGLANAISNPQTRFRRISAGQKRLRTQTGKDFTRLMRRSRGRKITNPSDLALIEKSYALRPKFTSAALESFDIRF